jgi:hypothetical protein
MAWQRSFIYSWLYGWLLLLKLWYKRTSSDQDLVSARSLSILLMTSVTAYFVFLTASKGPSVSCLGLIALAPSLLVRLILMSYLVWSVRGYQPIVRHSDALPLLFSSTCSVSLSLYCVVGASKVRNKRWSFFFCTLFYGKFLFDPNWHFLSIICSPWVFGLELIHQLAPHCFGNSFIFHVQLTGTHLQQKRHHLLFNPISAIQPI